MSSTALDPPAPHPPLSEQEEAMAAALSFVTEDSVAALLKSKQMSLVTLALRPENHPDVPGRLFNNNAIFTLTARKEGGDELELVLRILNCHAWRKGRNGNCEVATLKWLEEHSMPLIPRVVDFAIDSASSPLKCEFILMERLPGIQLREIWGQLAPPQRLDYLQQLKDWLAKLYDIPRPPGAGGPLASLRLVDGKVLADQPLILVDGPPLPPSSRLGFVELATAIIQDACQRLPASDLRPALEGLVALDLKDYAKKYEPNGAPAEYLRLCHNDLNPGNILCDPGSQRITGIVDWEGASWTFTDRDALDFQELGDWGFESAPGEAERRRFMELLQEIPCLYFFNATWYGAMSDSSQRQAASVAEGKAAETAVRRWFEMQGP